MVCWWWEIKLCYLIYLYLLSNITYRGTDTAPLILSRGARWTWVDNFMSQLATWRKPCYAPNSRLGSPRSQYGHSLKKKKTLTPAQIRTLACPACNTGTIPHWALLAIFRSLVLIKTGYTQNVRNMKTCWVMLSSHRAKYVVRSSSKVS